MRKTALILAGGKSLRFQSLDKCFMRLHNKPLILHAIDNLAQVADEIIVAARDEEQKNLIRARMPDSVLLVCDSVKGFGPLAGILSGLERASFPYSLVIGCDMPFVTEEVVALLFEVAARGEYDAVVPIWENGMLEPLHAVYKKEPMVAAIHEAVKQGDKQILKVIRQLKKVYFIEVKELRGLDSELKTFRNINTPEELRSAHQYVE
ncbi:MAG: molybdenum cofactor guanylyltransferase [Methanophagales archaeon ANME-1-THS]|nr:MAG: molybdenum cofactor guanylyltransferase [Methanophagales archaeon ANME-1-THS]